VSCRNGTENEAYIKSGITRTFLSPGCKMNLKHHLLQADFSLSLPEDIVNFQWDWDVSNIIPELEDDMQYLYQTGITDPTLQDLVEVKKRNPKALAFKLFLTFILSVVALGLIALVILWYFARDYILAFSCLQRIIAPTVRTLIDTSSPAQPPAIAPVQPRYSTALYPRLERELPSVPEPVYVKRTHYM
jgi:hypothetical protein